MANAAVKTKGNYTLKIVRDEEPLNPRENCDTFGKMVCWHSRYILGDQHSYENPDEFLSELVRATVSEKDVIAYVKDGKAKDLRLQYNPSTHEWDLISYDAYFKKWYDVGSFTALTETESGYLFDSILENMDSRDLMRFAEQTHLIAPLHFYDHSVQSTSMQSFHGRAHHADWDSGVVGFVYVSFKDIATEYGDASRENIEKTWAVLNAETETFDCYLRGECYGFELYEDGDLKDSCWGFLGSFDDAVKAIREYLPEEAVPLADSVECGNDDPEDEMEM